MIPSATIRFIFYLDIDCIYVDIMFMLLKSRLSIRVAAI
jgi:hypothetical protein